MEFWFYRLLNNIFLRLRYLLQLWEMADRAEVVCLHELYERWNIDREYERTELSQTWGYPELSAECTVSCLLATNSWESKSMIILKCSFYLFCGHIVGLVEMLNSTPWCCRLRATIGTLFFHWLALLLNVSCSKIPSEPF